MEYKTVAEAKNLPGLRLVLTMGVPGPWGEAAKAIFHHKDIPFIPVGQVAGADNEDLVAWTGIRNAPTAVLDNERPVDRWIDILMLAERIKPEPTLLPASSEDRARMFGIAAEICAEWGFGWCKRVELMGPPPPPDQRTEKDRISVFYGITEDMGAKATQRILDIMRMLAKQLKAQKAAGSPYLVGNAFSAADIYWAYFSPFAKTLPNEICPMPDWHRALYDRSTPEFDAVKDPVLFEHRDFMFKHHLKTPLQF